MKLTAQFDTPAELLDFLGSYGVVLRQQAQLDRIEGFLNQSLTNERSMIMNDADFKVILDKIDAASTKAGDNLVLLATTTQTVSDEVDALETALKNAGVSPAIVDQATAIGDKVQAVSDSLDLHATFLTAIAAKGAPVVPVPPPTPIIP